MCGWYLLCMLPGQMAGIRSDLLTLWQRTHDSEWLFSCRRRLIIYYVSCFLLSLFLIMISKKSQILAGAKDSNRACHKPQRQEILTERSEIICIWRYFVIIIYSDEYSCQSIFQQLLWTKIYKDLS